MAQEGLTSILKTDPALTFRGPKAELKMRPFFPRWIINIRGTETGKALTFVNSQGPKAALHIEFLLNAGSG